MYDYIGEGAYYGISPLFKITRIDELAPVSKEPPSATASSAFVETKDSLPKDDVSTVSPDEMKKSVDTNLTQLQPKEELISRIVSSSLLVLLDTLHES